MMSCGKTPTSIGGRGCSGLAEVNSAGPPPTPGTSQDSALADCRGCRPRGLLHLCLRSPGAAEVDNNPGQRKRRDLGLQEDRPSTLRGDCGRAASECDSEPAGVARVRPRQPRHTREHRCLRPALPSTADA